MMKAAPFVYGVKESVDAFRQGLVALIPSAERAALNWRDENPHDDWEGLTEALYEAFVAKPARQDGRLSAPAFPLPRYDYDLDSYAELSWLEAESSDEGNAFIFLRLLTRDAPFDTMQLVRLAPSDWRPLERVLFPYEDVPLRLRRRFTSGSSEVVRELLLLE